jgi:glycosyltransferase involved in cell wall biosynthesis
MEYKVLVLAAGNERGGAASHLKVMARAVKAAGREKQFQFGLVGSGPLRDELVDLGVDVLDFPERPISAIRAIRAAISQPTAPQILHAHGPRLNVLAFLASAGARTVWVSTIHSNLYQDFLSSRLKTLFFTRLNRACLSRADGLFVVHPEFGKWFTNLPVFYVPNGIVMDPLEHDKDYYRRKLRRQLGLPLDTKLFGIAARLDPVKDIPTIIRAVAHMAGDAHLVIAGDGDERGRLEQLTDELNVRHRVHFLGYIEAIREFYAALDIHVLASKSEGTPFSLLEAGLFKVPNVGTRIPGITRLLTDGRTGFCFPVGDDKALAVILDKMLADTALAQRLAENFFHQVLPEYTPENMLQAYLEGYLQLLS